MAGLIPDQNLDQGQIAELQRIAMADAAKRQAAEIAKREGTNLGKGLAVAPFTMAPDLLGMMHRAMIGNVGGVQPESVISGDPIRELIGLDPKSSAGLLGEMMSPMGTAAKVAKVAPPVMKGLLAAGPLGVALGSKGKKAANLVGDAVEAVPAPKIKAKDLVDQGSTVRAKTQFNQRLTESRQAMDPQNRAQVDPLLDRDFDGKVFMTGDGGAGFAMNSDGYISHLFKHPDAPFAGTIGAAMTKARAAGAKNMDAFDTFLVNEYVKTGAVETGRMPFDPRFASEDVIAGLGQRHPDYVQLDIGGQIPTQQHSLITGPRVQRELERWTGKGEPPSVAKHFNAERQANYRRATERGLEIGGEKWYWLGGLLDKYIVEFGADEGIKRFDMFMDLNAGVSGKSKTGAQIKRASVLYQRWTKGEPLNLAQPPGSRANPTGAIEPHFPPGYGHLAHDMQMGAVAKQQQQGMWSPIMQPKYAGYSENLKGNFDPAAIDTHQNLLMTGGKVPVGAKSPGYVALENRTRDIASDYGLQAGGGQAAAWTGGGDLGLLNVDPGSRRIMAEQMNMHIARTAEALEIPEAEALVRFMHGDTKLYSVIAAIFGAEVFREARRASQPEDSGA